MKKIIFLATTTNRAYAAATLASVLLLASCTKDLNRQPLNSNTSDKQYSTAAGYKQVLAKVYGSYSLVSSTGTGVSDVNVAGDSGIVSGTSG